MRPHGSPHHLRVQLRCAETFERWGWEVEVHRYATGTNVLGHREGTDPDADLCPSQHAGCDAVAIVHGRTDHGPQRRGTRARDQGPASAEPELSPVAPSNSSIIASVTAMPSRT